MMSAWEVGGFFFFLIPSVIRGEHGSNCTEGLIEERRSMSDDGCDMRCQHTVSTLRTPNVQKGGMGIRRSDQPAEATSGRKARTPEPTVVKS
jgi:hypothetical protein